MGQHRSTQRKPRVPRQDEDVLTAAIIALAERFGRYGYRRITALLRRDGWHVNEKRVYRIWRREGLKVPMKQPKRGRLWLNDGSCVRLRPAHKGHVWSYDFVQDRTHDGKVFRMLCVIDEFTRECLAIRVERKLNSRDVLDTLGDLFVVHGPPGYIRSDNVLHSELLAGFGRKASSRSFQIRVLKSITGWASAALEELAAIANTGSMRVRFAGPYRP